MGMSTALADTVNNSAAPAASLLGTDTLMSILPFAAVLLIFYALVIAPQRRQAAEQKKMVEALRRNDKVVVAGGILGTVARAEPGNDELLVEVADGVRIRVLRSSVSTVVARPEPVKAVAEKDSANTSTAANKK